MKELIMSSKNLKRVAEEIKAALDTTLQADHDALDEQISVIDADTFKQIARPLRRALRLVSSKPAQQSEDEKDAGLLFDVIHAGGNNRGEAAFELSCVLDDEIDAANRVYNRREFFILMHLDAIHEGKSDVLSFILRELRKGTDPQEIAKNLDESRIARQK
jgi:hypothetical protein